MHAFARAIALQTLHERTQPYQCRVRPEEEAHSLREVPCRHGVPWLRSIAKIEPLYPNSVCAGLKLIDVPKMLRMCLLQQWYDLAKDALEDAVYGSLALREFVGIELPRVSASDATTPLKFRRLMFSNDLAKALFEVQQGLLMRADTIVDVTIIAARNSTMDASGERDFCMHHAKKGNHWHHGMKGPIGVDAEAGIVHSLVGTEANFNGVTQAGELLHRDDTHAFGDAGHRSVDKREEAQGPQWHIAMQQGERGQLSYNVPDQMLEKAEKIKASIRAKVEHPFHVLKNPVCRRKMRYRGLTRNRAQLFSRFGLANLVIAKKRLLAIHSLGGPYERRENLQCSASPW